MLTANVSLLKKKLLKVIEYFDNSDSKHTLRELPALADRLEFEKITIDKLFKTAGIIRFPFG